MESIRRGHWANRQSSRIVPQCSKGRLARISPDQ
jgi:hypothetical protein